MSKREYLKSIGITKSGNVGKDNAYIVDLANSDEYGKIFSTLEKADDLDIMYDNQVITEQGSSLMYESVSEPFILNLIADFDGDIYQLIVNRIEG